MMLHARLLKQPSQGPPRNVCTTSMPPPKPPPPPRPGIPTAALPPPVKAAHPAAAAHTGNLLCPKIARYGSASPAWRMSSAQRGGRGQQGGQSAAKQALLQPSATARIQLGSSADPAGAKTFQGGEQSKQGAHGHAHRQVSDSGLAQSGPQVGPGQPSREHAASAAPAQSASTQPKGSEQSSAAAAAAARAPQWLSREFAIQCTTSFSVTGCMQLAAWLAMCCVSTAAMLPRLRAGTTAGLSHLACAFHEK